MAHFGSVPKEALALAVARGMNLSRASVKLGIGRRSASRWAAEPEFQNRVRELRASMTARSLGLLSASTMTAVKKLRRLLAGPDAIALRAAVAVLDQQGRLNQAIEIEKRLAELEKRTQQFPNRNGVRYA